MILIRLNLLLRHTLKHATSKNNKWLTLTFLIRINVQNNYRNVCHVLYRNSMPFIQNGTRFDFESESF